MNVFGVWGDFRRQTLHFQYLIPLVICYSGHYLDFLTNLGVTSRKLVSPPDTSSSWRLVSLALWLWWICWYSGSQVSSLLRWEYRSNYWFCNLLAHFSNSQIWSSTWAIAFATVTHRSQGTRSAILGSTRSGVAAGLSPTRFRCERFGCLNFHVWVNW